MQNSTRIRGSLPRSSFHVPLQILFYNEHHICDLYLWIVDAYTFPNGFLLDVPILHIGENEDGILICKATYVRLNDEPDYDTITTICSMVLCPFCPLDIFKLASFHECGDCQHWLTPLCSWQPKIYLFCDSTHSCNTICYHSIWRCHLLGS